MFDFDNLTEASSENISCISVLYDTPAFKAVAAVRTAVAVFSLACSLVVIFLVCCYKKYQFFPQRLILYLAIVSAVHSVVFGVSRVNYHATRSVLDVLCLVDGFAELYTSWVELLLIACITAHLFLLLVCGIETSQKEVLHLLVSFLTPLLWCWVPFIDHSFGSSGPWCGIRVHSEDDCSLYVLGVVLRFLLWQVPLYSLFLIFFLSCLLAILSKLKKDSLKWEGSHYDPKAQKVKLKMIRQVKPLLYYPMVFLLLKLPLLISQIYEAVHPQKPTVILWLLDALTSPMGGAVIALVYVCDATTRTKLWHCGQQWRSGHLCSCCYCCLPTDGADDGEGRRKRSSTHVVDYSVEVDAIFGDSMEGEKARRMLRQQARIEELLTAGARNLSFETSCNNQNPDHDNSNNNN